MNILRRPTFVLLPRTIPLPAAEAQPYAGPMPQNASQSRNDASPLVDKVRNATARNGGASNDFEFYAKRSGGLASRASGIRWRIRSWNSTVQRSSEDKGPGS